MHYQNLEKLKRLRLFGMVPATPRPARALDELQNLTDRGQLDFADQLALLIDREATDPRQRRLAQPSETGAAAAERLL